MRAYFRLYGVMPGDTTSEYIPSGCVRAIVYPGSFYDSQTNVVSGPDCVEYNDLEGNATYRQNVTAGAAGLDQIYQYNDLGELTSMDQGQLDLSGPTPTLTTGSGTLAQSWTLDGVGNWSGFSQSGTDATTQTRTTNSANQITGIATTSGTAWATPTYDVTPGEDARDQFWAI